MRIVGNRLLRRPRAEMLDRVKDGGPYVAVKRRALDPGGYFRTFWKGMCRWDPGTQSLYQS